MPDIKITATIREDAQVLPFPSYSDLRLIITRTLGREDLITREVTVEPITLPSLSDQAIVDEIRAAGGSYPSGDESPAPHGVDPDGNRLDHVWGVTYELPAVDPIETPDEWLDRAVHEAVGAASVAWGGNPRGTFDEARARSIAEALLSLVRLERVVAAGPVTIEPLVSTGEIDAAHPDAAHVVYADGSTPRHTAEGIPILEEVALQQGTPSIAQRAIKAYRDREARRDTLRPEIRSSLESMGIAAQDGLDEAVESVLALTVR